ncbi:CIC11C00000002070 [Sungouiella intermedia]|uniref:Increased recombination centers protein 6 n=1 Tax=Sungouiella intermedia TaxID=45354 RepID=A0A1L0BD01_9ASCO|nr:CIC11C00000002070 [[Candida] intermedia]
MAPNNVLVVGAPKSGKIRLAQHISGDYDTHTIQIDSHSGLIYTFDLTTKYFNVNLNILIEEFPDDRSDVEKDTVICLEEWTSEFSSDEFVELREALDGLVYTFTMEELDMEKFEKQLEFIGKIKELIGEEAFFVVAGAAGGEVESLIVEEIEDQVIANGFEFVNLQESGMNEYREKVGKDRLMEIFETHDWSNMEKTVQPEEYTSHKKEKMPEMAKGLLEVEDADDPDFDLERMLQKLRVDKEKVRALDDKEKKDYVDKLVEEYLEYF